MIYAATIFLSSFLLFLVQPLIARQILPWFGGTAAVWTTCMLFFQALLLAGYAYAHAVEAKLQPRAQAVLHSALLVAALALLPIAPDESWKPAGTEEPISRILLVLAATVGLPYLLLASTSPLVQAWFARARPGVDPYRLFAVSNLASLLALVGYPLAVEPFFGNREQVIWWSALFAPFAVLCAGLSWSVSGKKAKQARAVETDNPPHRNDYLLWLALSATGSVMLLAVTNHVTQNVAAIPLLWLAPLTLYLLTFILAFEGGMLGFDLYRVEIFWSAVLVWLGGMAWLLVDTTYQFDLWVQIGMYLSGLFVACMFCHGELYRARPAARHLTAFYLTISAGGALGGLLVAVVAPLAFHAYYELGLALIALALLAAVRFAPLNRVARWASLGVLLAVTACAAYDGMRFQKDVRVSARSFYGVVRVKEYGAPGEGYHLRRLVHGVIMHGEQDMTGDGRRKPSTYYQPSSGIGAAVAARQAQAGAVRVGVIGLGTGTLAAYGRKGDSFRFYEINPQVIAIARAEFTYLSDSAATIEIALGDARLNLEREAPQGFDLLAVDAFSSDAIPVHLITRQALGVYLRHLKPDGIVAFHVSNRFLSLVPVVAQLAKEHGVHVTLVSDKGEDDAQDHTTTDWVLVSRSREALNAPEIEAASPEMAEVQEGWRAWTDDYSNLVQILR
jgi:SAM-dependent methyltransferase